MMKRLLAALAAAMLSGCVTIGRPFPVSSVPALRLNQTTGAEVLKIFGPPHRTGVDDGDETWTYVHYKLRLFGPQDTRDLYIRFNKDRTIKSYSFNSSLPEDRLSLEQIRKGR